MAGGFNKLVVVGKRKTSVAKATITDGSGEITINLRPISAYPELKQLEISEPLIIAKEILGKLDFDISVNVHGGGMSSRIEASRLAIARAIVKFLKNDKLKEAFIAYDRNMIIADTRRKEARKPGDSKARAMRQTSYR
ncbi:MAG: 30S ribosomal protein S9 [archaeon]